LKLRGGTFTPHKCRLRALRKISERCCLNISELTLVQRLHPEDFPYSADDLRWLFRTVGLTTKSLASRETQE
jgi:hypothetical protein